MYNLLAPIIESADRQEEHRPALQRAAVNIVEALNLAPGEINQIHVAENGPNNALIRAQSAAPALRLRLT